MWAITALATAIAVYLGSVVYALYLHPLSKVPGPKLYAISRIPWIRDWLSGRLHVSVQRLHEQYGPIVRVAPDEVSFITASAWNDVYGQKVAKSLTRDRKWYANLTEGQDDIIVSSEADHMRFRKIFGPAFGDKALHESESVIMSNIDLLIAQLKQELKKTDGVADMVKWYNWTTFDIIGSLVVLQNIRLSSYGALMERYSVFKRLVMALLPRHLLEMRNFHLTVIRDKIARRSEKPPLIPDAIARAGESDLPISQGELEANLGLLTMAGSETSATALSAASFYLCRNKAAAQKLREEITTAFKSERDICHDTVKHLPYLTAVIREALRLYPPTPVGLPRRVMVVYITQYSAYRSSLNFRDPNEFRPERWLGDPSYASDNLSVVQPFITGPYSCIGKSLAYMEIGLVLAKMVWHFDWQLASSCCFEEEKVYALWQKSPMELRLRDRISQ
ncbi:cytochrome P450 [Aspergillus floccosus]